MSRKKYIIAVLIILLSGSSFSYAQNAGTQSLDSAYTISGIVKGEDGPLEDVSVSIVGSRSRPVVTGADGTFSIVSPSKFEWLSITPSGKYKRRRIFQNGKAYFEINLAKRSLASEDDERLDVFGSSLIKNSISASETFQSNQYHLPVQTVDQLMQTNIAGSYSVAHSGMPGSGAVNFIRGIKSMNTNNQPLYVIDGVPIEAGGLFGSLIEGNTVNPLSFLDPNDITSINVLKDNSAGYAYGVQGSNGVVLIETLQPSEIKTIIDFSARTGISMAPENIPQLNAGQYRVLANEALLTSNMYEENLPDQLPGLYLKEGDEGFYSYNSNTNWQDEIFRNSSMSDYYLRILGGDQIARYGLSVGYLNHNSIIKNSNYDRFNVRLVGTFSLFSWLRLYATANLSQSQSELRESALSEETSPIGTALFKAPILNPYEFDADGNRLMTYSDADELGVSNPIAIINNIQAANKNFRMLSSMKMEADISKDLQFRSLIGLNINGTKESVFLPTYGMELYYDGEAYNVSKSLTNNLSSIYNDNSLTYSTEINKQHQLSLSAGLRIHTNAFESDLAIGKNSNENDEYPSLQSGDSYLSELGGDNRKWNRMAMYANANYVFRDKYILNAGALAQNSSRIGINAVDYADGDMFNLGNVPFGLFYSLGGAWRISEEKFMARISSLEELKLRFSLGTSGNDDIGENNALRYYRPVLYREATGMIPGNMSERNLRYETVSQASVGLDLSLFANRLQLSADYYDATTENLLVYQPQDYYVGFSEVANNQGSISNKGWELNVFVRLLNMKKFKWDVNVNLSGFENTVNNLLDDQIITSFEGGEYLSRAGESVLNFYGLQYEGVYSSAAEASEDNLVNSLGMAFEAGDAKFTDLSGPEQKPDGVIDAYDKTIIGSPIPDVYGTLSTKLSYGRWSLYGGLQFVSGNEVFNYLRSQNESMTNLSNQSSSVLSRWYYDGQVTDVPRALWNDPIGNADFSTRWIEDGSYLRIKNITLSYKVETKFIGFRNFEIYATAYNLFTFSNYLGYDPEFSNSYHTMEQGIDYGHMPVSKQFLLGVKLGL